MDLLGTYDIQTAYRNMMNKTAAPKKTVAAKPITKKAQPVTEAFELNRKYISFDNILSVQDAYIAMLNKKVITEEDLGQDIFSTDLEKVKAAVDAGADINTVDKLGDTPLMTAADNGNARNVVKFLISKGADVNKQNKLGSTALLYAVNSEAANAYVIDDLIQAGADVNIASKTGNTPLGDAKAVGNQDIIDILTTAGATEEGGQVENPDLSELNDTPAPTDLDDSGDLDTDDLNGTDPSNQELEELDGTHNDISTESTNESIQVKDVTLKPKKIQKTRPITFKKRLCPVRLSIKRPKEQKPVTFKPKYKKTVIK